MDEQAGVLFPVTEDGTRRTTATAKKIWEAAVGAVDRAAADAIEAEPRWRQAYGGHVVTAATLQLKSSDAALAVARAGLEAAASLFRYKASREADEVSLEAAIAAGPDPCKKLCSAPVHGTSDTVSRCVTLRVGEGGTTVAEDAEAVSEVQRLADADALEHEVVKAVQHLVDQPQQLDLSGYTFVVFGATSELCPLRLLLNLGATVVGVCRPSKKVAALVKMAQESAGTLLLPLAAANSPATDPTELTPEQIAETAGADILTNVPELCDWLINLGDGGRLVIGSYIYLDGANHVRATMAMDAIVKAVCAARRDTCLAYLASPATVYPIPHQARDAAVARAGQAPWWHSVLSMTLGPFQSSVREPVTSADGQAYCLFDGISNVQGPNYALAKTLQNWRCIVARDEGYVVSANMAPGSRTDSVMHVSTVARAMQGMPAFEPMLPFEPGTASDLMGYLLISDLQDPKSAAQPGTKLRNPTELFSNNGVHGGSWRCPYTGDSIGQAAFLLGYFR
eukprot:m.13336 g.13336  ORF g.13336 m.13336 type:complete len:510 (-) comp4522_c1_seq1:174-1703(-)